MAGFFTLGNFLKRFAAAAAAIALVFLAWRYIPRGEPADANPPGTKTDTSVYTDSEGEFSVEFPAPYFLGNLPAAQGLPPRRQGAFRTGAGLLLTAVSVPLPPEVSFNYAEDSENVFKTKVASCSDPVDGPAVCAGEPEPVQGKKGALSVRRLFFGKKTLLMLGAEGKGVKAGDPDLERLSATLKTSWSALKPEGDTGAFRVEPRGHAIGVIFPGKPELSGSVKAGWKTAVYRYAAPDGSSYTATFMNRGGSLLTRKEFQRGWDAQLAGKTVAEQACRGGAFAIDCSAELLDAAGSAFRLRYVGSGNGVTVLGGAACPQDYCARSVSTFISSAYRQ